MSKYSNVTQQDLIILRKLAEQQKNQRALKVKNRILKQTHDVKLAENLSPITKKLGTINESTKQLGELVKKSDVEDGSIRTPAIENTTASRSLLDTLAFMTKSKNFFRLEEKDGKKYWNDELIKPLRENRFRIKDQESVISPDIQAFFANTKLTANFLDNFEKETVFDILQNFGFYDNIPKIGFKASRMKDALFDLPKAIDKVRNPPLPTIENVEYFNDLEGQGVKIIIPSNIIDIHTRLEVILGLKLSGHTGTPTEASNLINELYKRGEIENKQQNRNALSKFSNISLIILFRLNLNYYTSISTDNE